MISSSSDQALVPDITYAGGIDFTSRIDELPSTSAQLGPATVPRMQAIIGNFEAECPKLLSFDVFTTSVSDRGSFLHDARAWRVRALPTMARRGCPQPALAHSTFERRSSRHGLEPRHLSVVC